MDSRCKHCGEPFDLDEFHGQEHAWSSWVKAFKKHGCGAAEAMFDGLSPAQSTKCIHAPIFDKDQLDGIALIHDLLGDDIDGACSMMDDHFR